MSSFYSAFNKNNLLTLFKYGVVGVLGLVVDLGIFGLATRVFAINYLIANILSSSLAVCHNFIFNSYFTFKVTDRLFKRFVHFYLIAIIGMGVSSALLFVMVDIFHFDPMISKVLTIFIVALLQFYFNKKLTFSTEKND